MEEFVLPDATTFFHGTSASSAICVSIEGFRILDQAIRFWKGHLGTGIYITRNLNEAQFFGSDQPHYRAYVLELKIIPGTKIARMCDVSDRRLLRSLRREFGHEILTKNFANAIPTNKHLKPRELFAIISHLQHSGKLQEASSQRAIRKWLLRLHYHGYGHTENDLGVLIFDPYRLKMLNVWQVPEAWEHQKLGCDNTKGRSSLHAVNVDMMLRDAELELDEIEKQVKGEIESGHYSDVTVNKWLKELEHRRKLIGLFSSSNPATIEQSGCQAK